MNKTAGKEYCLSRESTRQCESDIYAKENRQCISTPAVFSWARVDYASRTAKNSPRGCFCAVFCDSAAAVRIHPPSPEKIPCKTKIQRNYYAGFFGGRGWIRTTEAESSRFTVCPHWPLGNTPLYSFLQSRTACIYYHSGACLSTAFYSFFGKIRMLDGMVQSRGRP